MNRIYRILAYRSVADHSFPLPDDACLPAGRFVAHLQYLEAKQFQVVPLETMLYTIDQGIVPSSWISLTFDQGFSDHYHNVFPALRARGWPATFFLTTGAIGGTLQVADRELPALTRDQVVEMKESGLISFGTHGHHQTPLTEMSPQERALELGRSKGVLEEIIRHKVEFLSYPGGQVDQAVAESAAAAGYRWGLTGWTRLSSPLARRRIPLSIGDTPYRLSLKLSTWYFPMKYLLRF